MAGRRPSTIYDLQRRAVAFFLWGSVAVLLPACGTDSEQARLAQTSKGSYDPETGVLRAITYDRNGNGRIDTWTRMDGARPVSSEIDSDEDGLIDRWEEYDDQGRLVRAGWIRADTVPAAPESTDQPPAAPRRVPDSWLYSTPGSANHHIEFLDLDNNGNQIVTRREFYENDQKVRVEEDKDGDGILDQWETWQGGVLRTAEFDEGHDGRPDRRFTYDNGTLVLIESEPDAQGRYTKRVTPGGR